MIFRNFANSAFARWLLVGLATGASVSLLLDAAIAQQPLPFKVQQLYRLPPKPGAVSRASGLYVELEPDGLSLNQPGYRTFEFQVHSPTPLTADTSITVRIFAADWPGGNFVSSAEADQDMLTGQQAATLLIRVPQYAEMNWLWWDVWIDGVRDAELSQLKDRPMGMPASQSRGPQEAGIRAWVATSATDEKGNQNFVLPVGIAQMAGLSSLDMIVRPLSEEFLDYTTFDVVLIDFWTLSNVAQNDPGAFIALRTWVAAGGNLWVENVATESQPLVSLDKLVHRGPEAIGKWISRAPVSYNEVVGTTWEQLGPLELLLEMPRDEYYPLPVRTTGIAVPGVDRWNYARLFRPPTAEERDGLVQDFGEQIDSSLRAANLLAKTSVHSENWFAVRRLGWGTVGAYTRSWYFVPRQLSPNQRNAAMDFWGQRAWPNRHGLVPSEANADFSNWLIPDVGLAPVIEFQILITLFVLGIGPLNYWLLKRAGRLHLLVLTVPAAAVLITGGLLAYGLLADGFSTRVRSLSITLLDQDRGEAVSWNRLSYYAAFAPREGLTFSKETAVYPILPGYDEGYASPSGGGQRD
ncbi:MAG: hypothetical protein ACR2NU_13815, partial [Aeoliella sp.]